MLAAPAAVAATAAPAGVAGRSKGSWSAWLRSWSPGSSYGKAWGSAGGLAVTLPARVRSCSARTRAVARGLRPARGSRTAAGEWTVCLAPLPGCSSPAPWGTGAGLQRRTRESGWCAVHPQTCCRPPRALSSLAPWRLLPGLRVDSRLLIHPQSQRGRCGGPSRPQPAPVPSYLLLDKRIQPNDRPHLRFSFLLSSLASLP